MIIKIIVSTQQLLLIKDNGDIVRQYIISTGKNGVGEQYGSGMTPTGWHYVRAKIGKDLPLNTVFKGRRPTGETYSSDLKKMFPDRDWILTRIMWLCGAEKGVNRLGANDTMRRYIYIHGCPDDLPMAVPLSAGCIRMRNQEIVELFDLVPIGIRVLISVT